MDYEQKLQQIAETIGPANQAAADAARTRWNNVAKPIGSLGVLEDDIVRIAALTGSADIDISKRVIAVFCADNGVVAQGVTQTDSQVTRAICEGVSKKTASSSKMAAAARMDAVAVDMGMLEPARTPGVWDMRIAAGTQDISLGPAMSRQQAAHAILNGVEAVRRLANQDYRIVAVGEMGIGNTTTATAMTCAFLGLDPLSATGRGAGLSDAGLARKRRAVRRALDVNAPTDAEDALDVLAKLGGLDIAGMAGAYLGGALVGVPTVVDGFISAVAALTAVRLCPACKKALLASHVSAEPAAHAVMDALGLPAAIDAGLRLGEGTGAACLVPLLDMALALYDGTTFADAGVEPYEVNPQ